MQLTQSIPGSCRRINWVGPFPFLFLAWRIWCACWVFFIFIFYFQNSFFCFYNLISIYLLFVLIFLLFLQCYFTFPFQKQHFPTFFWDKNRLSTCDTIFPAPFSYFSYSIHFIHLFLFETEIGEWKYQPIRFLNDNQLSGEIPEFLSNLGSLRYL